MLRLTEILATFSLLMLLLALGCGETDEQEGEVEIAINEVITDRWQKGYMTKDLPLYESAYWAEGLYLGIVRR
jgi:hypothetical protein